MPVPLNSIFLFPGMFLTAIPAVAGLTIERTGHAVELPPGNDGAHELSGITHAGGNTWYAVGDGIRDGFFKLDISLHPDGSIASARVASKIRVPAVPRADWEDIAYLPTRNSLFICNESDHSLTEYAPEGGNPIGRIPVPAVYLNGNMRANLSFEALAYGSSAYWTCNENALKSDGPVSTAKQGSVVRIQRFNEQFEPSGQWAYRTDPISGRFKRDSPVTGALAGKEASGVSAMVALDGNRLLVLERELGNGRGFLDFFRNRIYLVSLSGATDVSGVASLKDMGNVTPVSKTLLWEGSFALDNYEGMGLGPRLPDGSHSILLISDDGGEHSPNTQKILPLVLKGYSPQGGN